MSDTLSYTSSFYSYDPSGRIVAVGVMERHLIPLYEPGENCVTIAGQADAETQFVLDGVLAERPTLPAFDKTSIVADGTDVAILSVGEPFDVKIDGQTHHVADGTLEITATTPATYRVVVDHFPYQSLDVEIVAHAPEPT